MDPTANLEEIRKLAAIQVHGVGLVEEQFMRLVDLIEALDGWLSKGGFLPVQWSAYREIRKGG